jgi:hypothetical protein
MAAMAATVAATREIVIVPLESAAGQ